MTSLALGVILSRTFVSGAGHRTGHRFVRTPTESLTLPLTNSVEKFVAGVRSSGVPLCSDADAVGKSLTGEDAPFIN